MKNHIRFLIVALAAAQGLTAAVSAQTVEYDVAFIPRFSGGFLTLPTAINNDGVVVGYAQFSGPDFYLRGWRWSAEDGMTLLPPPPDPMSRRYAANDINDHGVIAGDGGYDSGLAWKFEDGTYFVLGTLSGLNGSWGGTVNNFGDMVGGAFDAGSFLTPRRAYHYTEEAGLEELFPELASSGAADINDAGQVVAGGGGEAFRLEPDGTHTVFPVPDGFARVSGARINEAGDVAGIVVCGHQCNRLFLYTDARGLELLPVLATRHSATGLNNQGQMVGRITEGVARGWIWSEERGMSFLTSLIEPDLSLVVTDAWGINDAGQIIAFALDTTDNLDPWRILVLTPIGLMLGDLDGDGQVRVPDLVILLGAWGPNPGHPADLDGDGEVRVPDLVILLGNWG